MLNKIRHTFFAVLVFVGAAAHAQDLNLAKQYFKAGQLAAAKEQIDGYLESDEGGTVAEAWLLKAAVYAGISDNVQMRYLVPDGKKEAFLAIERAAKLNKALAKSELAKDSFAILRAIYRSYAADGVAGFNAASEKKSAAGYAQALDFFKNALLINQFVIDQQWNVDLQPQRQVLQYNAAQAAINSNKEDEALLYSRQLADNRVIAAGAYASADFYNIYQWLTNYYHIKQDATNLVQYANLGTTIYPQSIYFISMLLNGYRQLGDYAHLLPAYEKAVKRFPDQHSILYAYCTDLFTYIYLPNTNNHQKTALSTKLELQLKNYISQQPDSTKAYLLLGKHYFNGAVDKQQAGKTGNQTFTTSLNKSINYLKMALDRMYDPKNPLRKQTFEILIKALNAVGRKGEADAAFVQMMGL
jgi:hypothetical protein